GLDGVPEEGPVVDRIRAALRAHLRVVSEQLDVATVFIREWRYLEGERREEFVAERRRYEERFRALFAEGRERGELRTDVDDGTAALLALSSVHWAYTWLRPGVHTDALAAPASADKQPSPPGQSLSPEIVPGAGLSGVAGMRAARYWFVHAAGVTSAGSFRIDFAAGPGNKIVV